MVTANAISRNEQATTSPMNPPRSEHDVLRNIARRKLDENAESRLGTLLDQQLDWDYLFSTAKEHGLLSLLHKHLSASSDKIPASLLAKVKNESVSNSQSVLHLTGKLLEINKLLTEKGIPMAIFKGPVLSQLAYGDIGLRRAGDIDVLVARDDFPKTKELLESLSYQMVPPLRAPQLQAHLSFHCEIQFMRDDWFTIVDLHWALAPNTFVFKLTAEDVLSRPQTISMVGTQVQTLSTEDLILYLSMHGAKHLWRRYEWISSLSEVVQQARTINWDTMLERAATARAGRMLGLGLRLAQKSSNVDIPATVFSLLDANRRMERLSEYILDNIFFDFTHDEDSVENSLNNFKVMDRKTDAVLSVLRAIYTPTLSDFEAVNLPSSLRSLYYVLRPLRLSKTYSSTLLRKFSLNRK